MDPELPSDTKIGTVIIVPARYASTRFPGKPLAMIDGIPMIIRVWLQAKKSRCADDVLIATDSIDIKEVVESAGGKCVMTPSELPSGTDRIAAAIVGMNPTIVVNLQGDEPLIKPEYIDLAIRALQKDTRADMSTLATPIRDEVELRNPNIVKVMLNNVNHALCFSRAPLPYPADGSWKHWPDCLRHIGLYVFRKSYLDRFVSTPPAWCEQVEKLEQLRALHNGGIIHVSVVDQVFPGVDTPEDIAIIETLIKNQNGC